MRSMAFFRHFSAFQAHFTSLPPEASPFGQCCTPSCANRFWLGLGLCRLCATASSPLAAPAHQRCARSANGSWTWFYCLPVLLRSRDDCDSPCVGYARENPPARDAPDDPQIDRPNPPRRPCPGFTGCGTRLAAKPCLVGVGGQDHFWRVPTGTPPVFLQTQYQKPVQEAGLRVFSSVRGSPPGLN